MARTSPSEARAAAAAPQAGRQRHGRPTDGVDAAFARKMWRTLEPVHGMIYFVPEAAAAYVEAGLDDDRAGYVGSWAAALGPVPAEVVITTFFNFNPRLVRRVVPCCWELAGPERLLRARLAAADAALQRLLGNAVTGDEIAEAGVLARTAATTPGLSLCGRPLRAAHTSLPWPDAPHLVSRRAPTDRTGATSACVQAFPGHPCPPLRAVAGHGAAGGVQHTSTWDGNGTEVYRRQLHPSDVSGGRSAGIVCTAASGGRTFEGRRDREASPGPPRRQPGHLRHVPFVTLAQPVRIDSPHHDGAVVATA
ncbi:MAG: hypothetical protein ACHQNA_01695 [Acidimicrobiales bacterium]